MDWLIGSFSSKKKLLKELEELTKEIKSKTEGQEGNTYSISSQILYYIERSRSGYENTEMENFIHYLDVLVNELELLHKEKPFTVPPLHIEKLKVLKKRIAAKKSIFITDEDKLKILKSFGFEDITNNKGVKASLLKNWDLTQKIIKASGSCPYIINRFNTISEYLKGKEGLKILLEILKNIKTNHDLLFYDPSAGNCAGIQSFKNAINNDLGNFRKVGFIIAELINRDNTQLLYNLRFFDKIMKSPEDMQNVIKFINENPNINFMDFLSSMTKSVHDINPEKIRELMKLSSELDIDYVDARLIGSFGHLLRFPEDNAKLRLVMIYIENKAREKGMRFILESLANLQYTFTAGSMEELKAHGAILIETLQSFSRTDYSYDQALMYFLNDFRDKIGKDNLREWCAAAADVAKRIEKNCEKYVFDFIRHDLKDRINTPEDLKAWGSAAAEIANHCKPEYGMKYIYSLSFGTQGRINVPNDLKEWGLVAVKIVNHCKKEAEVTRLTEFLICIQDKIAAPKYLSAMGLIAAVVAKGCEPNELKAIFGLTTSMKDQFNSADEFAVLLLGIKSKIHESMKHCKGVEVQVANSIVELVELVKKFGIGLFDDLLIPVAEAQTVASFLVFNSFREINGINDDALKTKDDLEILKFICIKKTTKANDILRHIIIKGINNWVIKVPLSKEAEIIKAFLAQSPAYLIELYNVFKSIYLGELKDKNIRYENLFKDVKQLKKDIITGSLTKDYEENMVLGVLYAVFAPEATIDRDFYKRSIQGRQDRQSDIPPVLDSLSGVKVRISKGSHMFKGELDTSSWNNLIEAVNEVNRDRMKIVPEQLGINLLLEFRNGSLRKKQKEYLKSIYAFDAGNGNSLPDFNTHYETLMKYKEFVGDRLKNNLIFSLLSKAQEAYPEKFSQMVNSSTKDYRRLAKTLEGLWKSNAADKESRIKSILEKNGFFVESINWASGAGANEINAWLGSLQSNVIDKSFVQKVFNELYGEHYEGMQKEMDKFEFKREGKSLFGKPFRFVLSKRKMHSVAMFNMGVCVAPDDKMWNSEDMWQMIIFDEEDNACGGVIYRTITEDGKSYLVASIQPSTSILSSVSPEQTYKKIMQFSMLMVKKLRYQNLLIPSSSTIHSNRGSMQSIISSMNYPTISLKNTYEFSYSPYKYSYNGFFIAG